MDLKIHYYDKSLEYKICQGDKILEKGSSFTELLGRISEYKEKIKGVILTGSSNSYISTRKVYLVANMVRYFCGKKNFVFPSYSK